MRLVGLPHLCSGQSEGQSGLRPPGLRPPGLRPPAPPRRGLRCRRGEVPASRSDSSEEAVWPGLGSP